MAKKLSKTQVRKLTHGSPRTRYPYSIERWYQRQITKLVKKWDKTAKDYVSTILSRYIKQGASLVTDASDDPSERSWVDQFMDDLARLGIVLEATDSDSNLTKLTSRFCTVVDTFAYRNVKAQFAIVGIDPISSDIAIRDYVKAKIGENTQLIKSLRQDYVQDLQKDIYRSITKGQGVPEVTKQITERTEMANRHAALIANDQTGTILGQLDAYRSKKAGAEKYIWTSMEDERVRPRHQELDRTVQRYDDPDGGDDGQLPGEPIRCRCVADPVLDF